MQLEGGALLVVLFVGFVAVASTTGATAGGARHTEEAAADLSMMAGELQGLIGQFRYED